jgi:hypothetical protein
LKQLAEAAFTVLTLSYLLKLKKHFRVPGWEAEGLDDVAVRQSCFTLLVKFIININY